MCSSKGTKKGHVSGPAYKGEGTLPVKFACKTRANYSPLARITLVQGYPICILVDKYNFSVRDTVVSE